MNSRLLSHQFNSDDTAGHTFHRVDCNYFRVNSWPHAEQRLRIEGTARGKILELLPFPGEVYGLPRDTYKITVNLPTALLSSWEIALATFIDVRPQPRPMSGQVYPLVRITNLAAQASKMFEFIPKQSGRIRYTHYGNALTWQLNTKRYCNTVGNISNLHGDRVILPAVAESEYAGGRATTATFATSVYVISGINYMIVLKNNHATNGDSIKLDFTIEPQDG